MDGSLPAAQPHPPVEPPAPVEPAAPGPAGSLESWEHVVSTSQVADRRPVAVTVAGALLVVAGGFAALAAALIVMTGDGATVGGVGDGASALATAIALVLGAVEIGAGLLVLRRRPVGRLLGIAVAGVGVATGVVAIGSASGLVTIAIFGFVIVALVTNAEAFRSTRAG